MDQQTFYIVLTVAAVVITLSFIVQSVMFAVIGSQVKKLARTASALQAKIEPLVDQAQGTVANVKDTIDKISTQAKQVFDELTVETRSVAAAISASSREISVLARTQAEQFAVTLNQSNTTIQRRVTEMDDLLSRTQERIEDTSIEVQTTLIRPLRELAALIAGLKRSVDVLFRRGRKQIDEAYQDEEMFI